MLSSYQIFRLCTIPAAMVMFLIAAHVSGGLTLRVDNPLAVARTR